MFRLALASRLCNVYCLNVLKILLEKVISSVIFDTDIHSNSKILFPCRKELFCISARRQVVCKMFFDFLTNVL